MAEYKWNIGAYQNDSSGLDYSWNIGVDQSGGTVVVEGAASFSGAGSIVASADVLEYITSGANFSGTSDIQAMATANLRPLNYRSTLVVAGYNAIWYEE
jgi:hypothetical protein